MEVTIDPNNISEAALTVLFGRIENIVAKKKGTVQLTELLTILNFPQAVNEKIQKARGPLQVQCSGNTCTTKNKGKKVEEDLPGTSAVGIIIHEDFSCKFTFNKQRRSIVIHDIEGLDADIPGPFNPDVDKITIRLPKHVKLEV